MPYTNEDYQRDLQEQQKRTNEDPGFFESALAGIYTGLWNIPKGLVSLPLEIYDAFGNTNLAKQFENTWDNLNPFGDEAEKTLTGRLTQGVAQLGLPITEGALIGSKIGSIVSKSLTAAREGKDLSSLASIGERFIGPKLGAFIGSGVGAGLVTDQNIGTFADMLRGTSLEPYALTMLDIEDKEGREDAYRKLLNRVKFGTENALFGAALIGAGKGIQALRKGVPVEGTSGEITTLTKILDPLSVSGGMSEEGDSVIKFKSSNNRALDEANVSLGQQTRKTLDEARSIIEATQGKKGVEDFNNKFLETIRSEKNPLLDINKIRQRVVVEKDTSALDEWEKKSDKEKLLIKKPEPVFNIKVKSFSEMQQLELEQKLQQWNNLSDAEKQIIPKPTLELIEKEKQEAFDEAMNKWNSLTDAEKKITPKPTFENLNYDQKNLINFTNGKFSNLDYNLEDKNITGYNPKQIKNLENDLDKARIKRANALNVITKQSEEISKTQRVIPTPEETAKGITPEMLAEKNRQELFNINNQKIKSYDDEVKKLEDEFEKSKIFKERKLNTVDTYNEETKKYEKKTINPLKDMRDLLNSVDENNKPIFDEIQKQKITKAAIDIRSAIDNSQINLLNNGIANENLFYKTFQSLGSYLTTDYKAWESSPWYKRYKITNEIREKSIKSYITDNSVKLQKAGLNEEQIASKAANDVDIFIQDYNQKIAKKIEENTPTKIIGGSEKSNIGIDDSVFQKKDIDQKWQEILLSKYSDPNWITYSTINALSNINTTVEFFKRITNSLTPIESLGYDYSAGKYRYAEKVSEENFNKSVNLLTNKQVDEKNAETLSKWNTLSDEEKTKQPFKKLTDREIYNIKIRATDTINDYLINPEKYNNNVIGPLDPRFDWRAPLVRKEVSAKEFYLTNGVFTKKEITELEDQGIINKLDKDNKDKFRLGGKISGFENLPNPLEDKYLKARLYNPIYNVGNDWLNSSWAGWLYKNTILLPKAFSQSAKTVLSVATHGRNFLTASAYVLANGGLLQKDSLSMLLPESFGGQGLLNQAKNYSFKQALGTLTPEESALYQRLLKVGVVNTSLEQGQIKNLFNDTIRNSDSNAAFNRIMNSSKVHNIYSGFQNLYTAEDSFWKIINWNLERNRFDKILEQNNINKDNYLNIFSKDLRSYDESFIKTLNLQEQKIIRDIHANMSPEELKQLQTQANLKNFFWHDGLNKDLAKESYDSFLDEFAGHLTRNQIPNYSYTTAAARALRLTPFGNFIAFPLEIMRTGNNIYEQSIKEITSGIEGIGGRTGIGMTRLLSFGTTVAGLPTLMVNTAKSIYNVSDDEMTALRRFVPQWSKDSILMPAGRDDKGYLKYINLSYATPYDTLIRPFNTLLVNVNKGIEDKETLYKSLGDSILQAGKEILNPFTSESIYTQALTDSIFGNGIGKDGKRIWNQEDDPFVKIEKSMFHIGNSIIPSSFATTERLLTAGRGKTDDYGKSFKLSDEIWGLGGFRILQTDPEDGMKFKINSFGSRLQQDKSLFTGPLLTGGRVTPDEIVNSYKYSEGRRYNNMREMYLDIRAARKLGVPENIIQKEFQQRQGITKDVSQSLMQGKYLPNVPNKEFAQKLQLITNDVNNKENVFLPNPIFNAMPEINQIININKNKDLLTDPIQLPQPSLKTGISNLVEGINSYAANVIDSGNPTGFNTSLNKLTPRQQDEYEELFNR
jgi:hypothetical protein